MREALEGTGMMEHRQCDQCGGYLSRGTAVCPACGNPMPGRFVLRVFVGLSLVGAIAVAVVSLAVWLWGPTVKFLGDTAAHDARMESGHRKAVEKALDPEKRSKGEARNPQHEQETPPERPEH